MGFLSISFILLTLLPEKISFSIIPESTGFDKLTFRFSFRYDAQAERNCLPGLFHSP